MYLDVDIDIFSQPMIANGRALNFLACSVGPYAQVVTVYSWVVRDQGMQGRSPQLRARTCDHSTVKRTVASTTYHIDARQTK